MDPSSVQVEFLVNKVALRQGFIGVLRLSLVSNILSVFHTYTRILFDSIWTY